MSKYTQGQTVYLSNGEKAEYVGLLNGNHIVHCYSIDRCGEKYVDTRTVASVNKVFDSPPTKSLSEPAPGVISLERLYHIRCPCHENTWFSVADPSDRMKDQTGGLKMWFCPYCGERFSTDRSDPE